MKNSSADHPQRNITFLLNDYLFVFSGTSGCLLLYANLESKASDSAFCMARRRGILLTFNSSVGLTRSLAAASLSFAWDGSSMQMSWLAIHTFLWVVTDWLGEEEVFVTPDWTSHYTWNAGTWLGPWLYRVCEIYNYLFFYLRLLLQMCPSSGTAADVALWFGAYPSLLAPRPSFGSPPARMRQWNEQ